MDHGQPGTWQRSRNTSGSAVSRRRAVRRSIAQALADGCQPAMMLIAGPCAAAAIMIGAISFWRAGCRCTLTVFLGYAQGGGDLALLHALLPAQQRHSMLPFRHVLDDLPAPRERDRRQRLRRGVSLGRAVPGLNPPQPLAQGRIAAEAAHRDIRDGLPQPAAAPIFCQAPQRPPGPGRRLKRGLNEIIG